MESANGMMAKKSTLDLMMLAGTFDHRHVSPKNKTDEDAVTLLEFIRDAPKGLPEAVSRMITEAEKVK